MGEAGFMSWLILFNLTLRPWEEAIQRNLQGTSQSTIFLSRGESWDWLLEINTDPVIATGQFKPGSIYVSIGKNYSNILPLSMFSSFTNSILFMINQFSMLLLFSLQRTTRCAPQQQEIATRGCHWLDRPCLPASPHHFSSQMACRQ